MALFADKLLVDHKENIERGGVSRHDKESQMARNWAVEIGYTKDG